jgi:hypothetical protein
MMMMMLVTDTDCDYDYDCDYYSSKGGPPAFNAVPSVLSEESSGRCGPPHLDDRVIVVQQLLLVATRILARR